MALYAIGDLHLSYGGQKSMDRFGRAWVDHEARIRRNWMRKITAEDTVMILGDLSWAKSLEEAGPDFDYVLSLPGRKIMLRGNHDMFWDAKKTAKLQAAFGEQLLFLQNNYYEYVNAAGVRYALVGTKGYTWEGKDTLDHAEKLVERETERLRVSFDAAREAGLTHFLCFLHYPPTNIYERDSAFTRMAEAYGSEQVVYAHCHGTLRFHDSIRGMYHGIRYSLASADCLRMDPMMVMV